MSVVWRGRVIENGKRMMIGGCVRRRTIWILPGLSLLGSFGPTTFPCRSVFMNHSYCSGGLDRMVGFKELVELRFSPW